MNSRGAMGAAQLSLTVHLTLTVRVSRPVLPHSSVKFRSVYSEETHGEMERNWGAPPTAGEKVGSVRAGDDTARLGPSCLGVVCVLRGLGQGPSLQLKTLKGCWPRSLPIPKIVPSPGHDSGHQKDTICLMDGVSGSLMLQSQGTGETPA